MFRPLLASVLSAATGAGPYLLPWRPRWYGVVHAPDARLEGVLAGGEAPTDLDAVVSGGTVTVTWTESVTPGVTGYRIVANPFGACSWCRCHPVSPKTSRPW